VITDGIARLIGDEYEGVDGLFFSESAGGNVFIEGEPQEPGNSVTVYASGGEEADSKLPYDSPSVQIIVRCSQSPRWGLDMWQSIYSLLQGKRNYTLPDNTYLVYSIIEQSSPIHIGPDDRGRYQFSMNIRTEILNTTQERP